MTTISVRGGEKLQARLAQIAASVRGSATLSVGFLGDATYPDGTSVAMVAATNEFGGTVPSHTVPAREAQVYRKLLKDDTFADDGRFVKRSRANFEQTVQIPEHEVAAHKIPPRPFFRRMISLGKDHWGDDLGEMLKDTDYNVTRSMARLGEQMVSELQQSITDQVYAPNAPSTVAAKGFDTTLLDTGYMKRSVAYKLST